MRTFFKMHVVIVRRHRASRGATVVYFKLFLIFGIVLNTAYGTIAKIRTNIF